MTASIVRLPPAADPHAHSHLSSSSTTAGPPWSGILIWHAPPALTRTLSLGPRDELRQVRLRGNIAAEFRILPEKVCGLVQKSAIYPLSYVASADSAFLSAASSLPLTLVVAPVLSPVLFSFALGQEQVKVDRPTLQFWNHVRSKVSAVAPELLASTLADYAQADGNVEKEGFDSTLRQLVPTHRLGEAERRRLTLALTRVFFAFDREGIDAAQATELLVGLSSLSGLAAAFRMADSDGDGRVDAEELSIFVASTLTVVLALNDSITQLQAEYVAKLIDQAVERVAAEFEAIDLDRDGLISWQDFAGWFKSGGHLLMPWAALIDLEGQDDEGVDADDNGQAEKARDDDDDDDISDDDSGRLDLVYEFALAPGHGSLIVTRADIIALELLVTTTGLSQAPVDKVLVPFLAAADDEGLLSKLAFDSCVRKWVPSSLSDEEQAYLSYVLSNLFFAFDRGGQRLVRVDEFCSGFALLCAGSKSRKLQYTFSLFDREMSGSIPVLDFVRFLRSILTVLFALNEEAAAKPAQVVYEAIDKTATMAVRALLQTLPEGTKLVTFEDLAQFYNTANGHRIVPFIELLDLSKFALPRSAVPPAAAPEPAIVFSFALANNRNLDIHSSDVARLAQVLRISGLHTVSPEQMHHELKAASVKGELSKDAFDKTLASLVSDKVLAVRDRALLNVTLNNVFYAYDRDSSNAVRLKELACGMSLFCKGKKSEKLILAFNVFDTDGDGLLSREDTARFLRSFLTVIFALTESAAAHPAEEIWETVDGAALDLADDIFANNRAGKTSFDDIAAWYGSGGYKRASFLELLDVEGQKWPFDLSESQQQQQHKSRQQKQSPEERPQQRSAPKIIFIFNISKQARLEITSRDVSYVADIIARSGIDQLPAQIVFDELKSVSENKQVTLSGFNLAVERLVRARGGDIDFVVGALGFLFEACDRDGTGVVGLLDLLGLIFLSQGSKSLKLAFAWGVMDEDEDGRLSRNELFVMLRAFLVMLHVLSYESNRAPIEDMFRIVDEAATELAAAVFVNAQRRKKDSVSFEEFAHYYSEHGGYNAAPWLELLNVNKFLGDNETAAPTDRIVFAFQLANGELLEVLSGDVEAMRRITRACAWCDLSPETLVRRVTDFVGGPTASRQQVAALVAKSACKPGCRDSDRTLIASDVTRLFESLLPTGSDKVSTDQLSVALSMLASGSKSAKLVLGWWALCARGDSGDDDDDGAKLPDASKETLELYLSVLLSAVFAFVAQARSEAKTRLVVQQTAKETADRVFEDLQLNSGAKVSFEAFGGWYSSSGHELSSWIELLNLAKWKEEGV